MRDKTKWAIGIAGAAAGVAIVFADTAPLPADPPVATVASVTSATPKPCHSAYDSYRWVKATKGTKGSKNHPAKPGIPAHWKETFHPTTCPAGFKG